MEDRKLIVVGVDGSEDGLRAVNTAPASPLRSW